LIDAAIGGVLAAGFVEIAGGTNDARTLWHLIAFKSVNGKAGHQLSNALSLTNPQPSALRPLVGLLVIMTVIAVVGVAYRVVTTAMWGAGIGKSLLGLRIVMDRPDGSPVETPSWGRAWARWAVPQGPGLIPLPATGLLAYLPAFRDERRRGLHDRAAGTIVVDVRSASAPVAVPRPAAKVDDLGYFSPPRATAPATTPTSEQETPVAR
jgi:uncharacterized RDD family membrane protein YckC